MAEQAVLTFSNVPLLFDCGRVAQQFLDRYLPVEQMIAPPENPARDDWHTNTIGQGRAGLPRPNYPPPPRPQVNTLYWPTGAARWARGWFLCDQAGHDALTSSGDAESAWKDGTATAKPFKCSTPSPAGQDPYTLEAKLYLLRPMRITATADETFGDLWLLPLVDQRYWWQFRRCGDLSGALDSWADLVTALGLQLGRKIHCPDVDTAYLQPDPIELCRSEENLAVVLDAVAYSIGRRVVVGYDETVTLQSYTAAEAELKTTRLKLFTPGRDHMRLQAGTPDDEPYGAANPWPAEVRIAFPKMEDASPFGAQEFWTSELSAADAATALGVTDHVVVESTSKTLHCSAWAMFQCGGSTTDPANKTNLDELVEQYALDYYGWLSIQYDHAWPGLQEWEPTGYDDHVFFELGTEYVAELDAIAQPDNDAAAELVTIRQNLARRYMTRVQSMPANHGVTSLLCQYEHAIPGVADGLMVRVNKYGIPARNGRQMYSRCCEVLAITSSNALTEVQCDDKGTTWQIGVLNPYCDDIEGLEIVPTAVFKDGKRYVVDWRDCVRSQSESSSSTSMSTEDSTASTQSSQSSSQSTLSTEESTNSTRSSSSADSTGSQSTETSTNSTGSLSSGSAPPSQSDKSTAIVPASWSPTGYAAWYTLEAPEVRFDDVLAAIELTEAETYVPIDFRYLDGIDDSQPITVLVSSEDVPVMLSAKVEAGCIRIRMRGNEHGEVVRATIRLSGIRKGFAGLRFTHRTKEQFEANERFLRSAYPGAGR